MARKEFSLKSIIVMLSLLIIGLVFIIWAAYIQDLANKFPWKTILSTLGTTIIISGVSTVLFDYVSKKEYLDTIEKYTDRVDNSITLSKKIQDIGLANVEVESNFYIYKEMLEEEEEIFLCMNDGRTWLSKHAEYLEKRLSNANHGMTSIVLMNPESLMIQVQANKTKTTKEAVAMKFQETIGMLKRLKKEDSKLKVYIHDYYNPHAVYMCSKYVIITPYFTSSGRRDVPLFKYVDTGDKCYYRRLKDDINQLIRHECIEYKI